ncbi:MAG: S8 family serine peptidase [Chloroflexales bacterium]|nr:S8 family serine peptidase [Chloroflexales bacterium]
MKRIHSYPWLVVLVLFALVIAVAPTQARVTPSPESAWLSAAAANWLAQSSPEVTETFIVGLRDDGAQAQANQARTIADKLTRRATVHRILSARESRNEAALRTFLQAQGVAQKVKEIDLFATFNGFSITATSQVITALRGWEQVRSIALDEPVQLHQPMPGQTLPIINAVEWNIAKIGADRVQNELAIDGSGIVVGNMDSGVRATHEALAGNYRCSGGSDANCWLDAVNDRASPYDDNGHGTHTMGTAVGSGGIGVAPGAQWIACKAFNSGGGGSQTDILECFDWFLAPGGDSANAPDVVNNSWGNSNGSNTAYQESVTNWINAGIYPSFSNGNNGPSCRTVGAPASYTNSVGVGATDNNDTIASFSSRGSSPFDNTIKPDLSAPGVNVRSAYNSNDSSYTSLNGTSMAAPHVSGLVALLLDANESLTIDQLTANMRDNALAISSSSCSSSGVPNNVYGWGRIQAYESVQEALGTPPPPPPPPPDTPPAAPSDLNASTVSGSQINLAWTDNATNEEGFRIERCTGFGCSNFSEVASVGANATSYSDTGLSSRTIYSYRVRAYNASGNSDYSNTALARTRR